jgi:hypothetical protein
MKTSKIKQITGLAVILGLLLTLQSSCSYAFNGVKGNGNIVKQERQISSFNSLEVGGAFKVFLTQGEKESLTVEADENLLEFITTEVRGNTLKISTTKDINNTNALNIYLTITNLDEMDISGACKLTCENKLKLNDLDMECSGASDVDLKLSANNIKLEFSGASQIDMFGSANEVSLDLSGASDLDALELEAEKYSADISGASHAKIYVKSELSVNVSGAASLKYKGEPKLIQTDVSGAGSLKKY